MPLDCGRRTLVRSCSSVWELQERLVRMADLAAAQLAAIVARSARSAGRARRHP